MADGTFVILRARTAKIWRPPSGFSWGKLIYSFEAAVKVAHIGSIMPAHHAINGVPCHANYWLLQEVARKEWGFDGFFTSDSGDIPEAIHAGGDWTHCDATSPGDAAVRALKAGVDVELPGELYKGSLLSAIKADTVSMDVVDRAARRVLTLNSGCSVLSRQQPPLARWTRPSSRF